MYQRIPKEEKPLQVLMFSATLHSPEIKAMAQSICRFPQWIDLKGKPTVPDNVDHALLWIDPLKAFLTFFTLNHSVIYAKESFFLKSFPLYQASGFLPISLLIIAFKLIN
jgi:superfamily II DNA/RNA helicase